jgi:hypothetical protein
MVQRFGARISVRMPRAARTRNVPNEAISAATIVPTTIAVERKRIATSAANAMNAAMLNRRSSSVSFCRMVLGPVRNARRTQDEPGSGMFVEQPIVAATTCACFSSLTRSTTRLAERCGASRRRDQNGLSLISSRSSGPPVRDRTSRTPSKRLRFCVSWPIR